MTPFKIHQHGHIRHQIKLVDEHITLIIYKGIFRIYVYQYNMYFYMKNVEKSIIMSFVIFLLALLVSQAHLKQSSYLFMFLPNIKANVDI